MSEIICELTGEKRSRKQISSHLQVLKGLRQRDFPNSPSRTASTSGENLSPHEDATFSQNISSLSLVSRFYESECLDHLASHIQCNGSMLRYFSSTDPAQVLASMCYKRITLVEGHMFPSIKMLEHFGTLVIDLWPRDPTRPDVTDRAWGPQAEILLAGLGVTIAAGATITLEMRWVADCERFEREYVERRKWRRVSGGGPCDHESGFCCARYELCGRNRCVEVAEGEKEFVAG